MSARPLIIGLLGFAVVFGVALWYFQTRAYYREVSGVETVTVAGQAIPVSDYRGLDGDSPLKLRGCFRLDPAALDGLPEAEATPLVAPSWFDCFDAGQLTHDLASGTARAVLAAADTPKDFEIVLAYYPDGRGYLWRQLGKQYRE